MSRGQVIAPACVCPGKLGKPAVSRVSLIPTYPAAFPQFDVSKHVTLILSFRETEIESLILLRIFSQLNAGQVICGVNVTKC